MGANGKVFSYMIMQFFSILQIDRFYVMIMTLWHLFLNRKKLGSPKSFFHVTKEVQQIFFQHFHLTPGWGQTERIQNYPLKMGKFDFKNVKFYLLDQFMSSSQSSKQKALWIWFTMSQWRPSFFWKGCFRLTPFWERGHLIFCYFLNLWAKKNYLHKSQIPGWYNHRKSANC